MTTIAIAHASSFLIAALAGWGAPPAAGAQRAPVAATSHPCTADCSNTQVAPKPPATAAALRLGWPIWIGIVCDDFEGQRRFYRDVLGLKETKHGAGWVWFDLDGKLLELFPRSSRPEYAQRGVTVGFVVDDIRAARATLIQRHVTPVGGVEHGGGQSWAYFRDGDGNLFEIVQGH
jgi:catechol 2,3-dioxygenase-like lactoylglutathione lyase family enzyme